MLKIINSISSQSDSTNWAIFKFKDNDQGIENLKVLSIDKYGVGGVTNLSKHLSNIKELKYCLLRFDYGFEIQKHQIILIIWSPSTAKNGQKRNIIPILRHKSLIKQTLKCTFELTISIHSHLKSSFILSELHTKNLVPEILLRVTKRTNFGDVGYQNSDSDDDDDQKMNNQGVHVKTGSLKKTLSSPSLGTPSSGMPKTFKLFQQKSSPNLEYAQTDKFFASKDWTLRRLKQELSKKYDMNENDIQVTHILYNIKKRSAQFKSRRQTEHIFNKTEDLDKTLSQLKLYHGSRVYISLISADDQNGHTHKRRLSNRFLAAQRRLVFTKAKTMSKTHKIKIKLKLSSHLQNLKSLKSLKSMKNREIRQQKLEKNTSLRVARYEEVLERKEQSRLLSMAQPRGKSKSVVYTSKTATSMTKQQSKEKKNADDNDIDNAGGSISATDIYRQTSVSDNEMVDDDDNTNNGSKIRLKTKSKTMPTNIGLSRTRSLSTTLTEGLSENILKNIVDKELFQEYTKPQIFEPVVVEKKKNQVSTTPRAVRPLTSFKEGMEEDEVDDDTMTLDDIKDDNDNDHDIVMVMHEEEENDDDGVNGVSEDNKDNDNNEEEKPEHHTKDNGSSMMSDTIFEDEESILPLPSSTSSLQTYQSVPDINTTEIECTLDLNDVFIVEKSIGRGKTAHVHYAIYKDECDIALKEFRFGRLTDKILLDFHSELETLKKLDHDNICRLLGHYVDEKSKQLYLAFEWLPAGCLYDVIHDVNVSIEYMDVLEMAIDIARGMKYLHEQKIIHRDLKSHNLLLDEAYRVKITGKFILYFIIFINKQYF